MNNIFKNETGFTLVEILLTIILIGVLSVMVVSLFINGRVKQRITAQKTTAVYFAQAGIEQVIADKQLKGYCALVKERYNKKTFDGIQQTTCIDTLGENLKKIVTIVKWANGSDSLVTFIGNY